MTVADTCKGGCLELHHLYIMVVTVAVRAVVMVLVK